MASAPERITAVQRRLLERLAQAERPLTTSELADGARSRAGTTTALRSLEAAGLVASTALGPGWYAEREYEITPAGCGRLVHQEVVRG
jgi:GTP-sensing pleiotropic transcriptional regulator CodY